MSELAIKKDLVRRLQKEINALQGYKAISESQLSHTGLGPIEAAFPNKVFPTAAVHEFISSSAEDAAATNAFISALLSRLMQGHPCLWISTRRDIYPAGLPAFGIEPHQLIFLNVTRHTDALWAIEEGLKCTALAAVVAEIKELSFTESRRLQLAVEQSRVTGLIHRCRPRTENTVACLTRWKIKPLPSMLEDGLPGVGHPRWQIQLLKVRNGRPGQWQVEWSGSGMRHLLPPVVGLPYTPARKAG